METIGVWGGKANNVLQKLGTAGGGLNMQTHLFCILGQFAFFALWLHIFFALTVWANKVLSSELGSATRSGLCCGLGVLQYAATQHFLPGGSTHGGDCLSGEVAA